VKITVVKGSLAEYEGDAAVVPHYENEDELLEPTKSLNERMGGIVRDVVRRGDFQGKKNQLSLLYARGTLATERVIVVGLGKRAAFSHDTLREAYATAAQYARSLHLKKIVTCVDFAAPGETAATVTEAIVAGIVLGLYRFNRFKTLEREEITELEEFVITEYREDLLKVVRAAARSAAALCRAVAYVRDIVSMPGNEMTPAKLAEEARLSLGEKKHTKVEVLDAKGMEKLGMNALLAVARGSSESPKFIIIHYTGGGPADEPIVLLGKAITFDSGGISLKPAEGMDEMKSDMAGGAAVMGAIMAASDLNLRVHCIGLIPATENKPGSAAYRPGDIIISLCGKTIEVMNTDAEGRLILADALAYADRFKPAALIDVATLTGACVVALGEQTIGMMGTDDHLKNRLRAAANETGERVWELPLWEEYHDQIKSDVADFKNTGGRPAGAITAACFLSKFVGDYPWVHLDIAGPAWQKKDRPCTPKGASGVGVRLLVHFLRDWSISHRRSSSKREKDGKTP
jgi:leucyl aminopeptidase